MSTARHGRSGADDDLVFRTLAAPGLEEDDLFAAQHGLPGTGVLWGDGMPNAFPPADAPVDDEAERRRRHEELLEKWCPRDSQTHRPPG